MLNEEFVFSVIKEMYQKDPTGGEEPHFGCPAFYDNIVEPLKRVEADLGNWHADNGVTKGVLIFDELDVVFKFPFTGNDEGEYEYSTCRSYTDSQGNRHETWVYETAEDYYGFQGAGDSVWDYCEQEAIRYSLAKKEGFERFLAETRRIGYIELTEDFLLPVYVQVKAQEIWNQRSGEHCFSKLPAEEQDKVRDSLDCYDAPMAWVYDCGQHVGKEAMEAFWEFCANADIDDLHGGNVGYINGTPVLIDYSSFRD